MMIAKEYGQDPRVVAEWEPEWLAAAATIMQAQAGAEVEIQRRAERRRKLAKGRGA